MRALTYTSSIPMILRLLRDNDFENFECVFGHGGILPRATEDILAFQGVVDESLTEGFLGIDGLPSDRRELIYDRVAEGRVRFFVVKDAIAHAKIYLLEREGLRRVVVGSANLSETAFSGKQAETLIAFDSKCEDGDDLAWEHYSAQYEAVRDLSTSSLPLRRETIKVEGSRIEEIPALKDGETQPNGVTIYVPTAEKEEEALIVPTILHKMERIKPVIKRGLADVRQRRTVAYA